jgi:hypothetical protein
MNPAMNNQQNQQMLQRSTSIDTQHVQVVSKEPRVCTIKPKLLQRSTSIDTQHVQLVWFG